MTEPEKVISLSLGVQRVAGAEPGQSEHLGSNYTAIIGSDESQALWSVLYRPQLHTHHLPKQQG